MVEMARQCFIVLIVIFSVVLQNTHGRSLLNNNNNNFNPFATFFPASQNIQTLQDDESPADIDDNNQNPNQPQGINPNFVQKKIELLLRKLQIIANFANQHGGGDGTTTNTDTTTELPFIDQDQLDSETERNTTNDFSFHDEKPTRQRSQLATAPPLPNFLQAFTAFAVRTIAAITNNFQQQTSERH